MVNIAIFGSGGGTNCENIIRYFRGSESVRVKVVVSNKADAPMLDKARRHGVPTRVIKRAELDDTELVTSIISGCDYIILAGFLPRIPEWLVERMPHHIINIHPSLLPKYGGKGMWGHHVHEAVAAAGDTVTGITIHYVDCDLDHGEHIAQFTTPIAPGSTADDIAASIHLLEMEHFPKVIEETITPKQQ